MAYRIQLSATKHHPEVLPSHPCQHCLRALVLLNTTDLPGSVFPFLKLLPGLLDLGCQTLPDKPILWLKPLGCLRAIVDQTKPGGFATTELGSEPEHKDLVGIFDVVHGGQLVLDFTL